ncbi:MAG: metallophosphoesterase family protein [Bryobacterales bacterium]|nr:metallophosphoesterase family protein [Bryobacterales bacterium]
MKRVLLTLTFAALLTQCYWLTAAKDRRLDPAVVYAPTPAPDRIILTWAGDPATTQAVTWRTDTSVPEALAEIAEASDGPEFSLRARRVQAVTEPLRSDLNEAHYHSVNFTELKPGSLYCYRVGDGFNWSEWNQFRTAAREAAPLTFLYVGDAQNDLWQFWSRVIRLSVLTAPGARFIVHAGDLINKTGADAEWGEWHRAADWINRTIPSFPTPGNHEYGGGSLDNHWKPQFTLPENGLPELKETNYFVDIQGVRMVSLDSMRMQQEQIDWLDRTLASNPNRWTILTFHYPLYSSQKGRDMKKLRDLWQPVLDRHAVDLVLTGHDHNYARSNLQTGTNARSGKAGTVYVVSVSGPKMRQLTSDVWWERAAEDTQLFQVIRVDGERLHYESFTARGNLYDAFELRKQKGKANKLINLVPASSENRRAEGAEAFIP